MVTLNISSHVIPYQVILTHKKDRKPEDKEISEKKTELGISKETVFTSKSADELEKINRDSKDHHQEQ